MMATAVTLQSLSLAARRQALPLLATSAAVGASMFVGDYACQWLAHSAAQKQKQLQQEQQPLGEPASASSALQNTRSESPLPPSSHPTSPLPRLPRSVSSLFPPWWDESRALSMGLTGFLLAGPWQRFVQRGAERLFPGNHLGNVARKMGLVVCSAPLGISATFYSVGRMQGQSHEVAMRRIREDAFDTWLAGFAFWPAVNFANLRYVALDWRPVVGSMAGAVWNVFVSHQANAKQATATQLEGEAQRERKASPPLPVLNKTL